MPPSRRRAPAPGVAPLPPWLALAWLVFVVYGSLVPLDYQPRPWAETLNAFARIPWLQLGVGSRADWVANILLYLPLGFLTAAWIAGAGRSLAARLAAALLAVPLCLLLALVVEFIQLYFPPRTVSLNDLLAETLGALAGVALFLAAGLKVRRLWAALADGGGHAPHALAWAYLTGYVLLSLFPFDFLLSQGEIAAKWSGDTVGGWLAGAGCETPALCLLRLGLEVLLSAPLGALLAHARRGIRASLLLPALLGLMLGLAIEAIQLFVASAVAQGLSVPTRGAGMVLGYLAYRHFARTGARPVPGWGLALAALAWLPALAWLNRWFTQAWLPWDQAMARFPDVHFLPFYYHYYTSETAALASLLAVAGMYAPLGAGYWLWARTRPRALLWSGVSAAVLCGVMEGGRLFLAASHPDPSNVFIAALAAMASARLLEQGRRWTVRHLVLDTARAAPHAGAGRRAGHRVSRPAQLLAVLMLAGLALALVTYPLSAAVLGAGLVAYGWMLWRHPARWLFWVPALLPVLNLAPLSGSLMFDELDALLMVTVAILYLRLPRRDRGAPSWLPFAFLGLSVLASLALGLWPLAPLDANAFTSYQSPYNALRLGKGMLWALLLGFWLHRSGQPMDQLLARFARGMTLGLLFTAAWVIWERAVYPGLFNFSDDFRVTGPFVEMHTGGGAIEAYLVATLPFAFLLWRRAPTLSGRLAAGVALLLGGYALGVTYSRAGYLGLAIAVAVLLLGLGWRVATHLWRGRSLLPVTGLVALAAVLAALPLVLGDYMPGRFAQSGRDAGIRIGHWRDTLGMMEAGDWIAGAGLGRYPATYFWRNGEGVTPSHYRFLWRGANTWLRLSTGQPLYFEQLVDFRPDQGYRLTLDVRATPGATLDVLICEKAMLYSTRCVQAPVAAGAAWRRHAVDLGAGAVGAGPWYGRGVVKFSLLAHGAQGGYAEVDNVGLRDLAGRDLLKNGDFRSGLAYWNFATDQHLAWHVKNLGLHILFEQGVLGLLAWLIVLVLAVLRLARQTRRGDSAALAMLAALAGMLVVGLFDSVLDVPRLALLLLLMLGIAGTRMRPAGQPGHTRPSLAPAATRPPAVPG